MTLILVLGRNSNKQCVTIAQLGVWPDDLIWPFSLFAMCKCNGWLYFIHRIGWFQMSSSFQPRNTFIFVSLGIPEPVMNKGEQGGQWGHKKHVGSDISVTDARFCYVFSCHWHHQWQPFNIAFNINQQFDILQRRVDSQFFCGISEHETETVW